MHCSLNILYMHIIYSHFSFMLSFRTVGGRHQGEYVLQLEAFFTEKESINSVMPKLT